jgi:hypothetical protein
MRKSIASGSEIQCATRELSRNHHALAFLVTFAQIAKLATTWVSRVDRRQPFPCRFLALLGNRGDRSLGLPLLNIEGSTPLGPRQPVPA